MLTPTIRQIVMVLSVWLHSYRRTPLRLALIVISIASTTLTLVIGWNLADALSRAKPTASEQAYLVLTAGAGTETRSFIPLAAYEQLRTSFSASPALRQEPLSANLVLSADIVLDERHGERLPTLLRGLLTAADGDLAGLRLIAGRQPVPGQRELLLSPALNVWVRARQLGDTLKLAQVAWRIVGVAERDGVSNQVEMYSTLATLQQQFQVNDIVSSISLNVAPAHLDEARRLTDSIQASRLDLLQLNSYGAQFVDVLHTQLKRFWLAFLLLTLTCTSFGIHTIALALESERDRVRQSILMLGFQPHAIRIGEVVEGIAIGACAAGLSMLLYAVLCQNLHLQSLLPSGAVSLSLPLSFAGAVLALAFGAGVGGCTFAWTSVRRVGGGGRFVH